jgi:hypothetical protein
MIKTRTEDVERQMVIAARKYEMLKGGGCLKILCLLDICVYRKGTSYQSKLISPWRRNV